MYPCTEEAMQENTVAWHFIFFMLLFIYFFISLKHYYYCIIIIMACMSTWHTTAHLQVLDVRGGVMLAWKMNGKELLPDHGYPVGTPPQTSQHVVK